MKVLFEDNHVLALFKPHGLLTQPANGQKSLEELAKLWIKKRDNKPGNVFLQPIHRLDRPVAGVVLFAKTSKALSRLQAALRDQCVEKRYVALVEGQMEGEGKLEHFLVHDDFHARECETGKRAVLTYRVLEQRAATSLVAISLETGRYHQIRAQFMLASHPIVGDAKYGSKMPWSEGIALHHVRFAIPHPINREMLSVESCEVLF